MRAAATTLFILVASTLVMLLPTTGYSQSNRGPQPFPGEAPSAGFIRSQEKAETLYAKGKYKDAFWYYSKELAPRGDKYAQYMVGYMLDNGQGVTRDPVKAAAWYQLAAERGHGDLVRVSLAKQEAMPDSQRLIAQQAALNLKTEYGDRALVERLIRRDVRRLREQTGSRVGSCNQNLRVIEVGGVNGIRSSVDGFCKKLNRRIDARLQYLRGYVEYGELEMVEDELDNPAINDDVDDAPTPDEQ
ncbi:MAG: hypothetical protein AAF004_03015 [Pseudomonadota bacterium]